MHEELFSIIPFLGLGADNPQTELYGKNIKTLVSHKRVSFCSFFCHNPFFSAILASLEIQHKAVLNMHVEAVNKE